jgi:DNA-binding CsgD family transcriptional regulator
MEQLCPPASSNVWRAARGKSAWDIGRILGISHHTAISYLNNAKAKLGVRTVVQAARVAAAKREQQN